LEIVDGPEKYIEKEPRILPTKFNETIKI